MPRRHHRTAFPSLSRSTLIEEVTIPLFARNAVKQKSRLCICLSPKPRYIDLAEQQTAFKIVKSLTATPISNFYTKEAGNVTGCLTSNRQRLKFIRNSSGMLMDILETDRIFSFARDGNGKIAGCSSVDEVVRYEKDKCGRARACLTTNKIFTFDRNEAGHIVGFSVNYLRDIDNNCTGLSTVNKEFVFDRDRGGNIEGCWQKEGPLIISGSHFHADN